MQPGLEPLDITELCLENICILLAKLMKSHSIVNWVGPNAGPVNVNPLQPITAQQAWTRVRLPTYPHTWTCTVICPRGRTGSDVTLRSFRNDCNGKKRLLKFTRKYGHYCPGVNPHLDILSIYLHYNLIWGLCRRCDLGCLNPLGQLANHLVDGCPHSGHCFQDHYSGVRLPHLVDSNSLIEHFCGLPSCFVWRVK